MKTAVSLDSIRLCERCYVPSDGEWYCGTIASEAPCSRCASWEAAHVLYPKANEPRLEGDSRYAEFVTSVTLVPYLPVVYDVNGYYRDLGVDPRATRKQIRDAYLARGGHTSTRLTYVLKQLLDPEVRARYDTTPLGSIFFDSEVAAAVRQRIAADVARTRLLAPDDGQPLVEFDLDHLMDKRFDFLDKHPCSEEDESQVRWKATWGWYRWATPIADQYRLSIWRGLLAKALADLGITRRLAVGWYNQPEPWLIRTIGRRTVVFFYPLNQPEPLIASQVANALKNLETLNTLNKENR